MIDCGKAFVFIQVVSCSIHSIGALQVFIIHSDEGKGSGVDSFIFL